MDVNKGGKNSMIGRILSEMKWAQEAQQMGLMGTHELERRMMLAANGTRLHYRKCYNWVRQTCAAGSKCTHMHYGVPYPANRKYEANWDDG